MPLMVGARAKVNGVGPPQTIDELLARARALSGRSLADVAADLGLYVGVDGVRTKGKFGGVLEAALGAHGGAGKVHDFPDLRVELKSVPVDATGKPKESTYVCTFSVADAEREEWATSWVKQKLSCVLFVPLWVGEGEGAEARTVCEPVLWKPNEAQESVLHSDFDDIVGLVGMGGIEELTAHEGRWLQVRPKARDGTKSAIAYGEDGDRIATVPRGFYLRTKLTEAILKDVGAVP